MRVGVGANRTAAVPGVTAAVDNQGLRDGDPVALRCTVRVWLRPLSLRVVIGASWPVMSPAASREAISLSALTGATIVSRSPWMTISGTALVGAGVPPVRIAAKAEPRSCAAR